PLGKRLELWQVSAQWTWWDGGKNLVFESFFEYLHKEESTCSYSENERDDELVTNPFADSSDGKDSDWNPGNESENMSDSNCITKLCDDKGV
ncbi:hypothetical protein PoB_002666900, partial [Plakobranchus ocellatus]